MPLHGWPSWQITLDVAAEEREGLLETAQLIRAPRHAARLLAALERARGESLPSVRMDDLEARLEG
ncbi:MAG: hypothetical protein KFB97_01205 [Cyanobium sp. M30B3]|nr:MAG: hypothetical protein KFB97_01205 [Cyanobium sp. M30B3]